MPSCVSNCDFKKQFDGEEDSLKKLKTYYSV